MSYPTNNLFRSRRRTSYRKRDETILKEVGEKRDKGGYSLVTLRRFNKQFDSWKKEKIKKVQFVSSYVYLKYIDTMHVSKKCSEFFKHFSEIMSSLQFRFQLRIQSTYDMFTKQSLSMKFFARFTLFKPQTNLLIFAIIAIYIYTKRPVNPTPYTKTIKHPLSISRIVPERNY